MFLFAAEGAVEVVSLIDILFGCTFIHAVVFNLCIHSTFFGLFADPISPNYLVGQLSMEELASVVKQTDMETAHCSSSRTKRLAARESRDRNPRTHHHEFVLFI